MGEGMALIKNTTRYLTGATPRALATVPLSGADPEAIHAVHEQLADAGFLLCQGHRPHHRR